MYEIVFKMRKASEIELERVANELLRETNEGYRRCAKLIELWIGYDEEDKQFVINTKFLLQPDEIQQKLCISKIDPEYVEGHIHNKIITYVDEFKLQFSYVSSFRGDSIVALCFEK